jgi:4-diphosphocytidyl-2-C-methyl-D-erythritol kinase
MHVRSYAKINWALRVTSRRTDGFHDLETLFQTISLHDDLSFEPSDRLTLTCDDRAIPTGESNLVLRAARALNAPPVSIRLTKRIPAGGGLGGGSSNAAATLVALDEMFGLETAAGKLHEMALALGSDVPFFLIGGTAHATGRGELLTPMPPLPPIPLLLVLPNERVATVEAFRAIRGYSKPIGVDRCRALCENDFPGDVSDLTNDFEEPVFARLPQLREFKLRLLRAGAPWAAMSGSGSTIVGAFRSERERDAAAAGFTDVRVRTATTLSLAPSASED